MGHSLRLFMEKLDVPVSGPNAKALTREVQNVAAANFTLGGRSDKGVTTKKASIAEELSFRIDRRPDQRSFWLSLLKTSSDAISNDGATRMAEALALLVRFLCDLFRPRRR